MTVVHYEEPGPLPPSRPGEELDVGPRGWVARLRAAAEIAGYIAGTPFVPEALRGKPEEIAAAILYGDEVGLQPMQSLAKIAVIKGRPTLTAEAQRGLIESAGHELWFEESTSTRAIAAGRRAGSDRVGRITWTLDDAKRAGISGQPNYVKYPAEMLRARASAALARAMFADVIGGMPAAEELEGEPDNGQPALEAPQPAPADVTPQSSPPAGRTRRRAKAPAPPPAGAKPVTPQPPPDPQPEPPIPPEPLATDAMRRQIFALMRDVGLQTGERDNRLDYTRRIIGRQLESSNELTIGGASRLIDELKAVKELPPDERAHRLLGEQEQEVVAALEDLAQGAGAAPTGETVAGDPDAAAGAGDPTPEPVGDRRPDSASWERLYALFEAAGVTVDEQLSYARGVLGRPELSGLIGMNADEADEVIAHLEQYDPTDPQTWPFPEGF